jgi:hypothetical protein
VLVFAASDKGGTGRSVTSANLAYRRALSGDDVCYLDFDFGSPTAAAVFDVSELVRGSGQGGLHSYLRGDVGEPVQVDVWRNTQHRVLRRSPTGSGRLVLVPGDLGGGEFATSQENVQLCTALLGRLEKEFHMVVVDLSAGRSYATDLVLAATARPELSAVETRWLVFHRWTRQHVIAATGLVFGARGIISAGVSRGHDEERLRESIRFVRTAVPDPESPLWSRVPAAQSEWMRKCDQKLNTLAAQCGAGFSVVVGVVPLEPVLQWQEQLITDDDVLELRIAGMETMKAFKEIAGKLADPGVWGRP